jgi:hypothetical protein
MKRAKSFTAMALVLTLIVLAHAASAQINPGTKLTGTLDRSLNSKDTQVGQTFLLTNPHTSNYDVAGATIYGHVSHVQRAGQGTPGKIELEADKINTKAGSIYKVAGTVSNIQVNTKSNAGKEALAAAGGALVGGLLGGGVWAAIGATGGFLVAKNSRENVTIPEGSLVTVHISSSTKIQ